MPTRLLSLLGVLSLVLAACTGNGGTDTTATTAAAADTTTSSPVTTDDAAPDEMQLAYDLEPGSTLTYEVDLEQHIELTSEGDPTALGEEDVPGEMSIDLSGTSPFTQSIEEGPEPGTYEVTIQGDFSGLTVEGTVDGEPVESSDIPDFAEMEPVDVSIVVDEQGNPVDEGEQLDDLLGGGQLGGLEGFGDLASQGTDLGRLVGPRLPDEPVTIGDTWSETIEVPMMMGGTDGEPVVTEITSEVTGTDTVEGHDVLVIDTRAVTSMVSFDLAEFLIGFFAAFVPEDATEAERAELDALVEDLRFQFDIDETVAESTAWFDPEEGYSRRAVYESVTNMVMDIAIPDEATGDLVEFVLDMSIDQSVDYRLVDVSGA